MTSPLVIMVAVEALGVGSGFLDFLDHRGRSCRWIGGKERVVLLCEITKRIGKRIVGMNKGKE